MDSTDKEMWDAFISGTTAAFEKLFRRHKGRIFNFALRMLADRGEAEDVVSDVFLQLFNKRYQEESGAALSTWLFTVARNSCLTRIRNRKGLLSLWFTRNDSGELEQWDVADTQDLASVALGKQDEARAVRDALTRLPVEQKEALILREYCDKDYAEIAVILGCSLEKVKILIFRGRETLRVLLATIIKEDPR